MTLPTILIIILILILIGAVPAWPHSRAWGYGPSGIVGVILVEALLVIPAATAALWAGHYRGQLALSMALGAGAGVARDGQRAGGNAVRRLRGRSLDPVTGPVLRPGLARPDQVFRGRPVTAPAPRTA